MCATRRSAAARRLIGRGADHRARARVDTTPAWTSPPASRRPRPTTGSRSTSCAARLSHAAALRARRPARPPAALRGGGAATTGRALGGLARRVSGSCAASCARGDGSATTMPGGGGEGGRLDDDARCADLFSARTRSAPRLRVWPSARAADSTATSPAGGGGPEQRVGDRRVAGPWSRPSPSPRVVHPSRRACVGITAAARADPRVESTCGTSTRSRRAGPYLGLLLLPFAQGGTTTPDLPGSEGQTRGRVVSSRIVVVVAVVVVVERALPQRPPRAERSAASSSSAAG